MSYLTSKPSTALKGSQYENFKISENSFMNPPLLMSEDRTLAFESKFNTTPVNPKEFCETFEFKNTLHGHFFIFNSFLRMLSSEDTGKSILLSMACGGKGDNPITDIFIADFKEKSKAEFLINAEKYFNDKDIIFMANFSIEIADRIDRIQEIFVENLEIQNALEQVINLSNKMEKEGVKPEERETLNELLGIIAGKF